MAVRIESQAEPIPGYKLLERLGGGGFGEVWKAVAPGGLLKAIKFVYGDLETKNEESQQRAEQELKAMSRVKTVRHPYILSLERFDIIEGQLIIVMELADRNLWDRFRECRGQNLPGIPRDELFSYMEETAEALDLMNIEYQLQHLDIKPQNIFLVYNHIKVADFGLVKDLEGMSASVTGGVTPVYAAPETFDGWVSRYCDQYSLAIVYQELLTGQRPFVGTNVRQLILQHLQGVPNLDPLPPGERPAVARALSKSPDSRFPSCKAFVAAIKSASMPVPSTAARVTPATSGVHRPPVGDLSRTPSPLPDSAARLPGSGSKMDTGDSAPASTPPTPVDGVNRGRVSAVAAPAEPEPALAQRVEEVQGDGVLLPALVIGLGHGGLMTLQRLAHCLDDRIGSLERVPNIRLLYLDTDPEAQRANLVMRAGKSLSNDQILLARLNRPHHYLRSREARTHIDTWLNPKMLYRIPRNLVTTGMRALGRLAFCDNYRTISRRLRTDLETCTKQETLTNALRLSGLGLRTNWPRVYVVTTLAGGSGSGMFLDVAYVVRSFLKEMGYDRPEILGVFLLPAADRNPSRTLALGNAYAALTELSHFSSGGVTFSARYDDQQGHVSDPAPPFNRCIMLTIPEGPEDGPLSEVAGSLADFIYRDLATPLGRAADEARNEMPAPGLGPMAPRCVTYASYRLSWPRRALLQRVARNLCRRVVQRWSTKDSTPIRETVKTWVAEQWASQQLAAEHLITHLQMTCERALGQIPEAAFAAITEPLTKFNANAPEHHIPAIKTALKQLEELVGRPETTTGGKQPLLKEALDEAEKELVSDWGQKMADLAVRLIEQPEYRLAGAEEAIRQSVAAIEQVLQHYEPLVKELGNRVTEVFGRIHDLLNNRQELAAGGRRAATFITNLVDLVRFYPKWRFQSLVLQRVAATYVSLRGYLSDQLRDVNYCRARLGELQRSFDDPVVSNPTMGDFGRGWNLFPAGCRNLDQAVKQALEAFSDGNLQELDARVQGVIQKQFTALVYICLTSANLLKNLEIAMQQETEEYLGDRLGGGNVAEMFFAHYEQEADAKRAIEDAFHSAAPEQAGQRSSAPQEFCILAVPPGPEGERFLDLAEQVLANVKIIATESSDDIVFYREIPFLTLSDLEQVGPLGLEAYRQMTSLEHFTPHNRIDIKEWRQPGC